MKQLIHARLFSIRIGQRLFAPGIFTTLVTIALLYVMTYMGMWQYEKGEYRKQLQATIESRKDLDPIDFYLAPRELEDYRYLPVRLRGRFDNERQFLYDNRIMNGVAGFHVYTPFYADTGDVLLVNRGWVPQQRTRDIKPDVAVSGEMVEITGLVDKVPSRGVMLADDLHRLTEWPIILQYVDTEELSRLAGTELLPKIVWLSPDTEYGYYHQYPALNLEGDRNTGYAVQWFAMCLALLVIYFVVNTRKQN